MIEQQFKTLEQLETELIKHWNLPIASDQEIKQWKYKTKLKISPKFLIGKHVIVNNVELYVKDVNINDFGKLIISLSDKSTIAPTNCYLKIINPINNLENLIQLHPGRKGKILWEKGYYLDEKSFKNFYYKSDEYKDKYSNAFLKKYGKKVNAPIQINKIKNKISNTIKERYSVDWFLKRGGHYQKIENTMIDKYGVKNLFNSIEWQQAQNKKLHRNFKVP